MATIITVNDEMILFSDGSKIEFDHRPDCCENNYADFSQLDDIARVTDFDTSNMIFEAVPNSGFRFGNAGKMFFVPCYSEQYGFYSDIIDIFYNDDLVLSFNCKEILK